MIAHSKKLGRPLGSRNRRPVWAPLAPGVAVPGASTSAAKMNVRSGLAEVSGQVCYVPSEGFVRWRDIEAQVHEAYLQWRRKKAMQGVMIYDSEEARQNEITGGKANGSLRRQWMREWREQHALLCERAA